MPAVFALTFTNAYIFDGMATQTRVVSSVGSIGRRPRVTSAESIRI